MYHLATGTIVLPWLRYHHLICANQFICHHITPSSYITSGARAPQELATLVILHGLSLQ